MTKKKEEKVIEIDITSQVRAIKNLFNFKKSNLERIEGEFLTEAETPPEKEVKLESKNIFTNFFKTKTKQDMKQEIMDNHVDKIRKPKKEPNNLISELKEVYELE